MGNEYYIVHCAMKVENDRKPNFSYLPKPNILLKANYSAKSRIAEYRIVPTKWCKFVTIWFWQNIQLDILQNISAEIGFGRTLYESRQTYSHTFPRYYVD